MHDIKLIIDNREKKLIELIKNDIDILLKNLDIGDIQFSIEDNIVIIIERKTICDLAASIKDGRYKEQKIRIKNIKNSKIIYLLEGNINTNYNGIPSSTILSVIVNTMIRDNITVYVTKDIKETYNFIKKVHKQLSKNGLDFINSGEKYKMDNISSAEIEYSRTIKKCKKENINPTVCFINQLSQIPGVSSISACEIVNKYTSMENLINEYNKLDTIEDKYNLHSELLIGKKKKRRMGNKISKKIYLYLSNNKC